MPELEILAGPDAGKVFEISHKVTVIGRQKGNDVVLTDTQASRKHAQIVHLGSRFVVRDLESRNGTFVNGRPVKEQTLKDGDEIQIGNTLIRFVDIPEVDDKGKVLEPILATRKTPEIDISKIKIKGYEILELIGKGGMGYVCKARQLSMDRIVAIKILHEKFASRPEFVARFISEARAAGKLNHPNVIQVHDVGQYNNIYFFTMEYLDGVSVLEMLKEKKTLPVPEATRITLEIARALDYAHKQGIVHRDIKPDNIMVTPDGKVKLADLGISKAYGEGSASKSEVMGSPHYMAPEQALGRPVDGRADIYSLGAAYYHMLVGDTPYSGVSIHEILKKHVSEPPPNPRAENPRIPGKVAGIVRKMMAKNPEERYQSAADLIADLEPLYEKLVPRKGATKAALELKKLARDAVERSVRKRKRIVTAVAVAVVLLAAAVYFLFFSPGWTGGPETSAAPALSGVAPAASRAPESRAPKELEDAYTRFRLLVSRNETDKALELGREILEKWSSWTAYCSRVKQEMRKIETRLMAAALSALESDFNELVSALVALSPAEKLDRIARFRSDHAAALDKYGDEPECRRILKEIDKREIAARRALEKAEQQAFETLKARFSKYVEDNDFFRAESILAEFKTRHPGKFADELDRMEKDLAAAERRHFDSVLEQAESEARNERLSLAISILKDYVRKQEGRRWVKDARDKLEVYAKRLQAYWEETVKRGKQAEKNFDFGTARRLYDGLRKQVAFDEERLKRAEELVLLVEREQDFFRKLIERINGKAPVRLTFDITGTLGAKFRNWSIVKADEEALHLSNGKGVNQAVKWPRLSGVSFERLVSMVMGRLTDEADKQAKERVLLLKKETAGL